MELTELHGNRGDVPDVAGIHVARELRQDDRQSLFGRLIACRPRCASVGNVVAVNRENGSGHLLPSFESVMGGLIAATGIRRYCELIVNKKYHNNHDFTFVTLGVVA